jgi:hypothetical protein
VVEVFLSSLIFFGYWIIQITGQVIGWVLRLPYLLKGFDKTEHCYALTLLSHPQEIHGWVDGFFL